MLSHVRKHKPRGRICGPIRERIPALRLGIFILRRHSEMGYLSPIACLPRDVLAKHSRTIPSVVIHESGGSNRSAPEMPLNPLFYLYGRPSTPRQIFQRVSKHKRIPIKPTKDYKTFISSPVFLNLYTTDVK